MKGFKSLRLSCINPIENGALRSCHVVREEVTLENASHLILILILVVINPQIDG